MANHPTKERILAAAETLMLEKSFHSVGINEILKEVGVPKGSFYHHFKSKEEFGIALVQHYVQEAFANQEAILFNEETEPNARLRMISFFEMRIASFIESNAGCPCLIMKLAMEVTGTSEAMRKEIAKGLTRTNVNFTRIVTEGQRKNQISNRLDASLIAKIIGCSWFGAVHQAICYHEVRPLRTVLQYIQDELIPAPITD